MDSSKTVRPKRVLMSGRAGFAAAALCLCGAAQSAPALPVAACRPPPAGSLTVVQEVTTPGQPPVTAVIRIKDGEIRTRSGSGNSASGAIFTASGDLIILMESIRSYRRLSPADLQRQRETMLSMHGGKGPAVPADFIDGGKTRSIDGRNAQLFTGKSADGRTTWDFWVTRDLKDLDLVRPAMICAAERMNEAGNGGIDWRKLPGFVVETTKRTGGREVTTTRLRSVSREPVPDEEFRIPAGYRNAADIKDQPARPGAPQRMPAAPAAPPKP